MAATDARPFPLKNTAYRVYFPIFDNDGDLVVGAAGLDSEISLDGGTFADCTNEATQIATSSGMYYLDLTSGEMNADCVIIIVKTTTTDAKTTPIALYPQEADDIKVSLTHWKGTAPNDLQSGRVDSYVGALASAVIAAGAFAANALDAVWATAARTLTAGTNIALAKGTGVTGFNDLDAAGIRTAAGLASANLDTQLSGISGKLPAALVSGRIDAHVGSVADGVLTAAKFAAGAFDAVWSVTARLLTAGTNIVLAKGTGVTGFNDVSAAQVNAEVVDALATDTYAEPSSPPSATASIVAKLGWMAMLSRNKIIQGTSSTVVRNDGDSGDVGTATITPDTGTVTRGKFS